MFDNRPRPVPAPDVPFRFKNDDTITDIDAQVAALPEGADKETLRAKLRESLMLNDMRNVILNTVLEVAPEHMNKIEEVLREKDLIE